METEKNFEKKKLRHSRLCRLLIACAFVFLALRISITVIEIMRLWGRPEAEVILIDTGYSYRFEMFAGYAQCSYLNIPAEARMVSRKTFCMAWLILSVMTEDLPVLAVLGYLRKIMKVIRESHSPFVPQTVSCTQKIGWLILLTGIFGEAVLQMGMGLLVYRVPYLMNPLNFFWIFAGAVVLLVGDILKWGCDLQKFSDETL